MTSDYNIIVNASDTLYRGGGDSDIQLILYFQTKSFRNDRSNFIRA